MELHNLGNQARKTQKETKKLFEKIKKTKPKDLDEKFEKFHDEAFESIDCKTCGNCCKTTSPIVTQLDINRLSKYLRIKPLVFTEKYLTQTPENEFPKPHASSFLIILSTSAKKISIASR